jgi:flagellin
MAQVDFSRINTNIGALNALNALNDVNRRLAIHQTRLATGKRINSAADDAAGFTISLKLNVRAQGLGVALDNIASAKNLMSVAEGHLSNIDDILTQMKNKALQAANDTLGTEERTAIRDELVLLNSQLDLEVTQAMWSNRNVLGGSSGTLTFQIGAGTTSSNELAFNVGSHVFTSGNTTFNAEGLDVQVSSTGTWANVVASSASAQTFMDQVDDAIDKIAEALSYLGGQTNRLTFQESSLTVARTNTLAAHSRIVNADMAYEQLEATKLQILQQTATAMLSQANMMPQSVLSLFR